MYSDVCCPHSWYARPIFGMHTLPWRQCIMPDNDLALFGIEAMNARQVNFTKIYFYSLFRFNWKMRWLNVSFASWIRAPYHTRAFSPEIASCENMLFLAAIYFDMQNSSIHLIQYLVFALLLFYFCRIELSWIRTEWSGSRQFRRIYHLCYSARSFV